MTAPMDHVGPTLARDVMAILTSAEAGEWVTIDELRERINRESGRVLTVHPVSRREIEEAIQVLRLRGEPIIGGNDGLRYTTDAAEIRAYATGRRRRLISIALGTRALLRAARRLDTDQPSLGL